MPKTKSIALILGVLTMSFLISYLVLAWTEPTQAPPGGNVPAPINVGSLQQWKEGGLGVGTKTFDLSSGQIAASIFYDRDNSSWYVNPSGTSVFSGNVGIGTTGPGAALDVYGGLIKTGQRNTATSWAIPNSCGGSWIGSARSGIWGPDYSSGCGDEWYIAWYPRSGESSTLEIAAKNDADDHIALMPSGNVGIGTTGPGYKLDVQGGQINASGGLCIAGSCKTAWDTATNYWTASGNNIYNNNTGNVGIGTTGPSYKLDVNGDLIANWLRTRGNTGWYSETYSGGWYMSDTTWIRAYNDKYVYTGGVIRADAGFQVDGYEMVGSNADMLYANRRNTAGGGIWVSDDGGFYDYNNGFVDFRGSTGIRVLESNGSWGDNSIRATNLCMKDDCRSSWPAGGGVSSVSNSDGTLTISPTTGAVVASLNLGKANTWTGAQTFNANTNFPGSGIWNTSGNVGIGTTAPTEKLDITGNAKISGDLTVGGTSNFGCTWYLAKCDANGTMRYPSGTSMSCDKDADRVSLKCPTGEGLISGGCKNAYGGSYLRWNGAHQWALDYWQCDWENDANDMYIQILCCRATVGRVWGY